MASICPKASPAPAMGPQRSVGLRDNHNCYQHSDMSDFSRMKREPSISGRGGMSFIFQPSSEKPKLPFLNMLRVWVIFQLPWGSGPQYKSGAAASSSILSSCLPLLREVGKSQFILPRLPAWQKRFFVVRASLVLGEWSGMWIRTLVGLFASRGSLQGSGPTASTV